MIEIRTIYQLDVVDRVSEVLMTTETTWVRLLIYPIGDNIDSYRFQSRVEDNPKLVESPTLFTLKDALYEAHLLCGLIPPHGGNQH